MATEDNVVKFPTELPEGDRWATDAEVKAEIKRRVKLAWPELKSKLEAKHRGKLPPALISEMLNDLFRGEIQ